MGASLPFPPFELAHRVGTLADTEDPWETYERHGRSARAAIEAALGDGWSWQGKTVLDFGAGAGRTLRQFAPEFAAAEFHACDIDATSVRWLDENLPAVRAFVNEAAPPLDRPDATFDLVYNVSVFTHLIDTWAEWLIELRRVLKPGGLLVVSFMGRNISEWLADLPFDEDRTGMFAWAPGHPWEEGGPMVMHSPWWISDHWGRAFDVVGFVHSGEADPWFLHSLVVLRHPGTPPPSAAELARPGDDPREAPALAHNLEFVLREAAGLRRAFDAANARAAEIEAVLARRDAELREQDAAAAAEAADLRAVLAQRDEQIRIFRESASWRLTAPLRAASNALRRR
jgi:SAM-dependent methyltransferase